MRWIKAAVRRTLELLGLWRPLRAVRARLRRRGRSETSKCRRDLAPFCTGDGVDVGYGGDPIVPHAICVDLPRPYARYERHPQHLHGDARNLHWFTDGCLDFVYSSHLLEDFEDTAAVLDEWLRVLAPGGHLVLFLPDEPTYREHCRARGLPPNPHHVHEHFGPGHLEEIVAARADAEICHLRFPVGVYSFEMVIRKLPATGGIKSVR